MEPIRKFVRLPTAEKWLFVEAGFWLVSAQTAILVCPFRWIARRLGRHMAESPPEVSPGQAAIARQVSRALDRAGRYLPWTSRCLAQAIAGKMMLRRRGTPSTLYLGMTREDDRHLAAHAWLRCGGVVLTGAEGRDRCVVVGTFAEVENENRRRTT